MTDLVVVFKDMIEAQDKAMELRLAGQDHRFERVRGEKLEVLFNDGMKKLKKEEQAQVINTLVLDGFLPGICQDYMNSFDGSWSSIKTDFHKVALDVLQTIETKLPQKDILDLASHSIKHMGISWDDFYKVMAEVKNIIKYY